MSYKKGEELFARYKYRECLLEQGERILINWIPGSYARIGLQVKGREDDGSVTTGWKITKVFPLRPFPSTTPN